MKKPRKPKAKQRKLVPVPPTGGVARARTPFLGRPVVLPRHDRFELGMSALTSPHGWPGNLPFAAARTASVQTASLQPTRASLALSNLSAMQGRARYPAANAFRARALAAPVWTEDRETLAVLMVPFFVLALLIGTSQAVRPLHRFAPVAPSHDLAQAPARPEFPKTAGVVRPLITAPVVAARPGVVGTGLEAVAPVPGSRAASLPPTGRLQAAASPVLPTAPVTAASPEGQRRANLDGLAPVAPAPAVAMLEEPGPGPVPRPPAQAPMAPAHVCLAPARGSPPPARPARTSVERAAFGQQLAAAARSQLGDFVVYTDRYRPIAYPMGDVPPLYGVCTDVVIRAYRALGLDLQVLVHVAKGSGDTNIDHRRVETLRSFFAAHGEKLPVTTIADDYRPGDIVTYYRPQNRHSRTHIAIVSAEAGPSGRPMIIHNRGWGPQAEDALFVDQITGHYRYAGPSAAPVTNPQPGSSAAADPATAPHPAPIIRALGSNRAKPPPARRFARTAALAVQ